MAVMLPREKWSDGRLDDLNKKVDDGFNRLDKKIDRLDKKFDRLTLGLLVSAISLIATRGL